MVYVYVELILMTIIFFCVVKREGVVKTILIV